MAYGKGAGVQNGNLSKWSGEKLDFSRSQMTKWIAPLKSSRKI